MTRRLSLSSWCWIGAIVLLAGAFSGWLYLVFSQRVVLVDCVHFFARHSVIVKCQLSRMELSVTTTTFDNGFLENFLPQQTHGSLSRHERERHMQPDYVFTPRFSSTTKGTTTTTKLTAPTLLVVFLFAMPPAIRFGFWARGRLVRRKRRRLGLCLRCGYDVRFSPGGACSECGTPVTLRADHRPDA